jgi:hypothetical protein
VGRDCVAPEWGRVSSVPRHWIPLSTHRWGVYVLYMYIQYSINPRRTWIGTPHARRHGTRAGTFQVTHEQMSKDRFRLSLRHVPGRRNSLKYSVRSKAIERAHGWMDDEREIAPENVE